MTLAPVTGLALVWCSFSSMFVCLSLKSSNDELFAKIQHPATSLAHYLVDIVKLILTPPGGKLFQLGRHLVEEVKIVSKYIFS